MKKKQRATKFVCSVHEMRGIRCRTLLTKCEAQGETKISNLVRS